MERRQVSIAAIFSWASRFDVIDSCVKKLKHEATTQQRNKKVLLWHSIASWHGCLVVTLEGIQCQSELSDVQAGPSVLRRNTLACATPPLRFARMT